MHCLILLAESTDITPDVLARWASVSVNGVVSMLLVWIITKGIPQMREQEQQALSEMVGTFREERAADRESRHTTNNIFNETVGQLFDANREELTKLTEAVIQLRMSNERLCKYPGSTLTANLPHG